MGNTGILGGFGAHDSQLRGSPSTPGVATQQLGADGTPTPQATRGRAGHGGRRGRPPPAKGAAWGGGPGPAASARRGAFLGRDSGGGGGGAAG